MKIVIPKPALTAIQLIENNGYEAFIVGGFVRDSLLDIKSNDCDITTSARPETILKIFEDYKCYETGIKHGTVMVIIDDMPLEITTYRIENEYKDLRHPSSVIYVDSLKDDLARRDFTINALAYHPEKGVIDYFNGISDLHNETIRCINDPDQRFREDALRILRALRFSSTYDFNIEPKTKAAILQKYVLLANISQERITEEWLKTLSGISAKKILTEYRDVWLFLFRELRAYSEVWFEQQSNALYNSCHDLEVKVAIFLYALHQNDLTSTDNLLGRLRLTKKMIKNTKIIMASSRQEFSDAIAIKKQLKNISDDLLIKVIKFKYATNVIDQDTRDHTIKSIRDIVVNHEIYRLSQLAIKGNELSAALPIKPAMINDILDHLLDGVIEQKVENQKDKLLNYAKYIIEQKN